MGPRIRAALLLSTLGAAACELDIPLAVATDGGLTGDASNWIQISTDRTLKDEVDILFMVDDSASMQPKQKALRDRFPQLIEQLDAFATAGLPASYHIGVVTSDLGAPGIDCPYDLGGKLQAVGMAAPTSCQGPLGGAHYLVYDQKTPANDNNPTSQTPAATFTCMATVTSDDGSHVGCGFESQLESVYKALHDPIPENVGFLRDEAILVVVWLTDEDDCSVDPDCDLFSNMTDYGVQSSYKCTAYGITCDDQFPLPETPQQSFASCTPATSQQGSKLIDVQKYIDYFTRPAAQGGVKADPRDVVLAAIDAPTNPFGTSTSTASADCGGAASCTVLDHSCIAADDSTFFGDPAVRLNAVIDSAQSNQLTSICDSSYSGWAGGLGAKIENALHATCVMAPLVNPGAPSCVANDLVSDRNGGQTRTPIPACDKLHSALPCWSITTATSCPKVCDPQTGAYQQVGIQIDRGVDESGQPNPVPDDTTPEVTCQIVPRGTAGSCM